VKQILEEMATLYCHLMLHVTYFQFSISVVNGTVPDIYFGMQPATQANSAFHPSGIGNEDQLWKRQVWFIP